MIEQILTEEESLIITHRAHIDEQVNAVKEEMSLLNEVDKAGSDVERFVVDLDKILAKKMKMISDLRGKL